MRIKVFIASLLTCSLLGKLIAYLYKNTIPFRGLNIDTSIPEISSVNKAELFWEIYESGEIRFIQKYLPEAYDVIELGSSIGVVSSIIRKGLARDARLICVEAHPALCKHLRVNLELNNLHHNVTCLNKAISYSRDKNSGVYFSPGKLSTTGRLTCGVPPPGSILVETVMLSNLKHDLHIDKFTLVADIEGAEISFICEDKESLASCQHLFLELHDTTHDGISVSVEDMLKELTTTHGFHLQDRYADVVYLNRTKTS